jgi:hypothetical protein
MFVSAALMQKDAVSTKTKTSPEKENGILIATDVAKAKRGKGIVHFVRIRIGSELAKKAKFEPGMKVDLLIGKDEDEGKGMLVRVPPDHETGWILAGLRRTAAGEQPLQLRYTWHVNHPSIAEPALGTEVKASSKEGISFRFPEGTKFNELAVETEVQPELMFRRRSTDKPHRKVA